MPLLFKVVSFEVCWRCSEMTQFIGKDQIVNLIQLLNLNIIAYKEQYWVLLYAEPCPGSILYMKQVKEPF